MDEIRIVTSPRTPILEARVRKVSRDIIGFRLDDSRRASGVVPLSWKIMERDDGGVVQLIYAGPTTANISVVGTIVGQSQVSAIRFTGTITSPSKQLARSSEEARVWSYVLLIGTLFLGVKVVFDVVRAGRKGEPIPQKQVLYNVLWMILCMTGWIVWTRILSVQSPPFGI